MYRDVLTDATFHQLLLACDRDLADTARGAGCKRCNGVVHSAHYWRKPRGRPCRLGREHDRRFSFCCAVDGCRSRATPPSLRFLGPKVYIAAIVVLIAILRHGATALRMRELTEVIGVDRRTVERWRTHRDTILEGRSRRVHAAGRSGPAAGRAHRALRG